MANITRIYRQALDKLAVEPNPLDAGESGESQYQMEMAFSRGLYTGWFRGINNQRLVHGNFGKKRGVYLGEVVEVRRDAVLVRLEQALQPGDGVVFDAGNPEEKEEGGRVYEVLDGKNSIHPVKTRFEARPGRWFTTRHRSTSVWPR